MNAKLSQRSETNLESPDPSAPRTKATPLPSTRISSIGESPEASNPIDQMPAFVNLVRVFGSPETEQSLRCSIAPAADLAAVGVIRAARC